MLDAEYILQRIAQVHAYQRRRRRIEIALDHRQMHGIVDRVLIGHEAEIAELGADVRLGDALDGVLVVASIRSEEHTSELQSLMRISYAVFCLKKKKHKTKQNDSPDS